MDRNGKGVFWELFIGFFILLGVVLVFLEDVARIGGWAVGPRTAVVVLGFVVDMVFSVEFVVRAVGRLRKRSLGRWFVRERGWIDLASSWLLLLFVSGPLMWGLLFGGAGSVGFLSMTGLLRTTRIFRMTRFLRVFRVLRILRFLRFLRLLRLGAVWKKIKPSKEGAGEMSEDRLDVLTAALVSFVAVLTLAPLMPGAFFTPETALKSRRAEYAAVLEDWYKGMSRGDVGRLEMLRSRLKDDPRVIYFYVAGATVVDNSVSGEPPSVYLPRRWFFTDYRMVSFQQLRLYYSVKPEETLNARVNLLLETIVVVQMLALVLLPEARRRRHA